MKRKLRHPIRSITEPYGKAGLMVAILALVLATTGAAFAAGGLTKPQEKQVIKIAKKYAGKPGAQGPAGATGPAGTNGTNGTNGKNGKGVVVNEFAGNAEPAGEPCKKQGGDEIEVEGSGEKKFACNGVTGFTKTLPKGETETGSWYANVPAESSVDTTGSFNIPLAAELDSAHVHIAPNAECPGTAENPQAKEGNLCVYTTTGNEAKPTTIATTGKLGLGAGTAGFLLVVHNASTGLTYGFGTWAVTGK